MLAGAVLNQWVDKVMQAEMFMGVVSQASARVRKRGGAKAATTGCHRGEIFLETEATATITQLHAMSLEVTNAIGPAPIPRIVTAVEIPAIANTHHPVAIKLAYMSSPTNTTSEQKHRGTKTSLKPTDQVFMK